ncbi:MAG: signal peptidase II [Planctomycetota bacterium]|nr:signal peptidase II [Planctomycetota bacterium]
MTSADSDTPASTTDSAASAGSEVPTGSAHSAVTRSPEISAASAIPAWRSPAAWCVLFLVFIAAVSLDLWSKDWAFRTVAPQPVVLIYEQVSGNPGYSLPWHPGVTAIAPDLLDFHLVLNHGAVFGIGQGRGPLFIAFTVLAVCTALWVFGKHTSSRSHLSHIGLALVLAGGIGNMYDRVAVGAVRDFLHLFPHRELPWGLHWPGGSNEWFPWVFNIADSELIAGMLILMLAIHLNERRQAKLAALAVPPTTPG